MSLEVFKSLEDRKNEIRQVHNEIENLRKNFAQDKTIREGKIKLLQIEIEKEKQTILEKEQGLCLDFPKSQDSVYHEVLTIRIDKGAILQNRIQEFCYIFLALRHLK
jgi:hypothetical protein